MLSGYPIFFKELELPIIDKNELKINDYRKTIIKCLNKNIFFLSDFI